MPAANVKHAPHTDLPWSVDQTPSGFEAVNEETTFTVARIPTSQRSMSTRMMETNAAYIVHAANAYPQMVETVKDFILDHRNGLGPDITRLEALLRELGELQ